MQSRGGPERERERARTWRWRQLSRGGREGCGDAESGRECGRQGPESLRPAWGAWLSPRGRSWVAGGSQPFACSRDRSLRSHEQVSVPPVCSGQEARGGGGGPHAGSASRERPWPAWHVLLSHLRDRRNARTGADFKPSRGAQSGTRLSPSPGVRAPSSGAGQGGAPCPCVLRVHSRTTTPCLGLTQTAAPAASPRAGRLRDRRVGAPGPAPPWGVVWLCVGEPYFTERRPTADACAPRSGFGWCLRRPAGHSPERQWPDHRACLLLIQRVWPAAREKPPCSRVSDAPTRRCDRRCETLRSRRSDRCLICILIAREVGPLFMCSQSRQ